MQDRLFEGSTMQAVQLIIQVMKGMLVKVVFNYKTCYTCSFIFYAFPDFEIPKDFFKLTKLASLIFDKIEF